MVCGYGIGCDIIALERGVHRGLVEKSSTVSRTIDLIRATLQNRMGDSSTERFGDLGEITPKAHDSKAQYEDE